MLGELRANRAANDPNRVIRTTGNPDSTLVLAQVVDGFTYNTQLLYLGCRYWPNALAQLDVLRRAANYRARWYCVPDDLDSPIQPFDTLYYQVEMSPNSYVWGYTFSIIGPNNVGSPVPTDILIQVVDSQNAIPLFQDYASGGGAHPDYTSRCLPIVMSEPRLILAPGLVNVSLSNRTENAIYCQLILYVAEPCNSIARKQDKPAWRKALSGIGDLR